MKKNLIYFSLFVFAGLVASCSDDDEKYTPIPPVVSIENTSGTLSVAQEDTLYFKANIESPIESSFQWSVNGKEASTDSILKFTSEEMGKFEIALTAKNADGEHSATTSVEVYGKYKYGTFVLNEGSGSNGTLIFISPKGGITDSIYYKANGSFLGGVSPDLFIANNKMYIVSQNGGGDGFLVIANAETLKKEVGYQDELKTTLSWPTHIAVLGENDIYLRDNNGVSLFNPSSKTVTFIKGTKNAQKNRMAVADNKVFASTNSKTIVTIETGKDTISHTIEFDDAISGLIKASDGNLWVSSGKKIMKINTKDYSVMQENEVEPFSSSSNMATPAISAKGDTLYFSGGTTKIYRHVFSKNQTDFMVDARTMVENAGIVYNYLGVNPMTGEVLLNTIKGYGKDYLINNISVFDFSSNEPKLAANYENYTRFPAGIFFTYNFE
ncbi:DUF5074 domain-containing protein [Parabacteroides sp. AF18-52]|uniref:DUF5074 domain-containing protein n=1 Tax=Parabacteroides TaxID=375288 RepID=UPI000F00E58C|nr:DUF5074 domain-containing protein [Parabacteroides sp. AF18-52]RHR40271.1 DUF5074 domain-containing protein [Parabacteroides sp. AF18-52]